MGKIVAWQCEDTGKIFACETEYERHRAAYRARARRLREHAAKLAAVDAEIAKVRTSSDFSQIAEWLEENGALLARRVVLRREVHGRAAWASVKLKDVRFEGVGYNPRILTSHSAPLGHRTCSFVPEKKVYQPGWKATMNFRIVDGSDEFAGSRMFEGTGINLGTGGGGGSYRYECTLYAEDFSLMAIYHRFAESGQ